MLDKENDILIINSSRILIAHKSKLIIAEIEQNKDSKNIVLSKSKKIFSLNFPDDILSIHHLTSIKKIIISCISNKSIYFINEELIFSDEKTLTDFTVEKNALIFQSNKKMTSIISYQENNDKYFLLISDKFGEISMKPITKEETKESFAKEIKIVTGHCDTINYIKLSYDKKLLLSSDNFGKIKIYNFPNIFNVLSVILYHESIYDFINKNKINLDFLGGEKILEVKTLNKNEYVILKTNKKYFVIRINDTKYEIEKIKEIDNIETQKEKFVNKFFDFNGNIYNIEINTEKNEINAIKPIL